MSGVCVDIEPDCASLGDSICTSSDDHDFARDNCAAFCQLCTNGNTQLLSQFLYRFTVQCSMNLDLSS